MTYSKIKTHLKLVFLVLATITIFACKEDPVEPINPEVPIDPVVDIVWEPIGSLPSEDIQAIRFVNNGNIWARGGYSENRTSLYLSTNNGDTWNKKYIDHYAEFINPVNGYFFCSDRRTNNKFLKGLLRSTNNGENWETITIVDTNSIMDGNIEGVIFTASGEMYLRLMKIYANGTSWDWSCYYSNDNGNTWVEKSKGLPSFWLEAAGKDGTLYAKSLNGIYHSTDKGTTWLPSSNYNNYFTGLTFCNDGSIFGFAENVGIVKSTDKGTNWTKVNTTGFSGTNPSQIIFNSVTKDLFVNKHFGIFHGDYQDDLLEKHYQIYRSNNLGKDWKIDGEWNLSPDDSRFGFSVNPKTGQMFVVTASGVYRTKNYPK